MKNLGISALEKLLADPARDYVTAGDLAQIVTRIQNRKKQKRGATPGASLQIENKQLHYIRRLLKLAAGRPQFPKKELETELDKMLRRAQYDYYSETHWHCL